MRHYFEVYSFIRPVSKAGFADLLSRIVLLRKELDQAKKDFRQYNTKEELCRKMNKSEEYPRNFTARFEALEEAMHKFTVAEVQKWQQAIVEKYRGQDPSFFNPTEGHCRLLFRSRL